MKARILLILGILAIPTAAAGATVEGSYQTYNLATFSTANDNPSAGSIIDHTIQTDAAHGFEIQDSNALISISYAAFITQSASGVWRYTVSWNGTTLDNCLWDIETSSSLAATQYYPYDDITCRVSALELDGEKDFIITRAVLSGSPAVISHETISYRIDRSDLLVPDMTNEMLETFEVIAPLISFLILAIWADRRENPLFYLLAIVGGTFVAAITTMETVRWFILIGCVLMALRAFQVLTGAYENED